MFIKLFIPVWDDKIYRLDGKFIRRFMVLMIHLPNLPSGPKRVRFVHVSRSLNNLCRLQKEFQKCAILF